jgi:hypothetical protein
MNANTKRAIVRWMHLLFGLPLIGYIYGPPAETVQYLPFFRYLYAPMVMLTGLWLWKGHVLTRLVSKK